MKLLVFLLFLFLFIKIVVAFNDQSLTCGINKLKKEKPLTHFFETVKLIKETAILAVIKENKVWKMVLVKNYTSINN